MEAIAVQMLNRSEPFDGTTNCSAVIMCCPGHMLHYLENYSTMSAQRLNAEEGTLSESTTAPAAACCGDDELGVIVAWKTDAGDWRGELHKFGDIVATCDTPEFDTLKSWVSSHAVLADAPKVMH